MLAQRRNIGRITKGAINVDTGESFEKEVTGKVKVISQDELITRVS